MALPLVAIVGAPNVGKSTIFNRFVGRRHSIVDDNPGVTRDRIYCNAEWLGREFRLVDTGGIEISNRPFQEQIRQQAEIAILEADVILYIVDGKNGVTTDDRKVAKMLLKANKPIVFAVNKIDNKESLVSVYDFYSLGLGEPIALSGEHGIGVGDVLDKIVSLLPIKEEETNNDAITFSVVGRPNVGKSSLVNAILQKERTIVSSIEGTTRDSVDTYFNKDGQDYIVIDTAGLKKRGKIYENIDKYAMLRAFSSIDRSDIVILVIDATTSIVEQDKHVAGLISEGKKGAIIVVNKWDEAKHLNLNKNKFEKEIRKNFVFLSYAPIVFLSAKNRTGIEELFSAIAQVHQAYDTHISTSVLNTLVNEASLLNPAPDFNGGRLKIYYASQVKSRPPTIVFFVNNPRYMHFSYERYLENKLREAFSFDGTPIDIILRERT